MDGVGGAANEPGTCHHNGQRTPPGPVWVPGFPSAPSWREGVGGGSGGALCGPLGPLHTIIKHWPPLSQEARAA